MTLSEFLLARIAEDEDQARAAQSHFEGSEQWEATRKADYTSEVRQAGSHLVNPSVAKSVVRGARHIARWDPARVLAECEAKRRLVDHYLNWVTTEPDRTDDWARAARFELEVT